MTEPADIINRVLDLLGRSDLVIGEIQEGTEAARPALRAYGPALRQLLRAAHWDFGRKAAPLTLLADATGQTPNVGTVVPAPWVYEYALPIDCCKVRFVPWNVNNNQTTPPQVTGLGGAPLNAIRLIPSPFLVTSDYNYPVVTGAPLPWDQAMSWEDGAGQGPQQRTVILTNVPNASAIYTALMIYPSQWDSLFEQAFVQYLTSQLAMSLGSGRTADKLAIRKDAISGAKEMIAQARVVNGNESSFPQTTNREAAWISARNSGAGWGAAGYPGFGWGGGGFGGAGGLWCGYDALGFADGSVY